MTSLFIDTSYLIAVENADDQYHKTAAKHWRDLLKSPRPLLTSSYVLVEVVILLNNRRLHSKAVELGNNLLRSRSFNEKVAATRLFDAEVVPLLAHGVLRPNIDSIFPLAEIVKAHQRLESNESFGKVVVVME